MTRIIGNLTLRLCDVVGFQQAMSGMRLSHNTVSDSDRGVIGPNDLRLALSLVRKGTSHAKFTRLILAYMSIRAPRYWWQEFDTYRVGVEKLSQSTVHTLMRGITAQDFTAETQHGAITEAEVALSQGDLLIAKANLPEGSPVS